MYNIMFGMTITAVYVDDYCRSERGERVAVQFKTTDMGKLGVTVVQDGCLWPHQEQYFLRLLEKHGMTEAKICCNSS